MDINEAQKRIRWATFLLLAVLAVLLTILDRTGNLDTAFSVIRNPMASVMGWSSARTNDLADVLEGPRDLETARNEIAQLQDRIDTLERENEELREIEGEYQLLLDLFNRARHGQLILRDGNLAGSRSRRRCWRGSYVGVEDVGAGDLSGGAGAGQGREIDALAFGEIADHG